MTLAEDTLLLCSYAKSDVLSRSINANPRDAAHAAPILAEIAEDPGLNRFERKGHKGPAAVLDILGQDPYLVIVWDIMHQVHILHFCFIK